MLSPPLRVLFLPDVLPLQDQKKKLEKAEGAYHKVNARLKDLQSSYQEGSAAKLLETLTEDVNNLRQQVGDGEGRKWRGKGRHERGWLAGGQCVKAAGDADGGREQLAARVWDQWE